MATREGSQCQYGTPGGKIPRRVLVFGESGEGVVFAFDLKTPGQSKVYGLSSESYECGEFTLVADDFITFVNAMGRPDSTVGRFAMSPRGYMYLGLLIDGVLLLFGCLWLYSRALSHDQYYRGYCGGITMSSSPCSLTEYRWMNFGFGIVGIVGYLWPILLVSLILPPAVLWLMGKSRAATTDA